MKSMKDGKKKEKEKDKDKDKDKSVQAEKEGQEGSGLKTAGPEGEITAGLSALYCYTLLEAFFFSTSCSTL